MGSATKRRTTLFWNTHRAWAEAFARAGHRYLTPVAAAPIDAGDAVALRFTGDVGLMEAMYAGLPVMAGIVSADTRTLAAATS